MEGDQEQRGFEVCPEFCFCCCVRRLREAVVDTQALPRVHTPHDPVVGVLVMLDDSESKVK
jgi:hypothetical protein